MLIGRQSEKTAAMCIKFGKRAAENPKRIIGMFAYTEKQAFNLFFKTLMYLKAKHPKLLITKGKDKPTKHVIHLTNGSIIMCYAVGLTGEGIRTFTLTDLVIDEAAPMAREVFIALRPMLSVTQGHLDISSTPRGKHDKEGNEKYFYSCSKDDKFKKFYISAEDCPRHSKKFLEEEKERMTKLEYAQEYLAKFLDEIRQFFPNELIKDSCILSENQAHGGPYFLGVDIARMGKDESTFEILEENGNIINQIENITTKKTKLTDTTNKILELDTKFNFGRKAIGIDDAGLGAGVYDFLLNNNQVRRKIVGLNNARKSIDRNNRKKTLMKEDMYIYLKILMEKKKIQILDDNNVKESLKSIWVTTGVRKLKILYL